MLKTAIKYIGFFSDNIYLAKPGRQSSKILTLNLPKIKVEFKLPHNHFLLKEKYFIYLRMRQRTND